mgnify:CR=1 FL=1
MSLNNRYLYQGFIWPTIDLFYVGEVESFEGLSPDASEVSEVIFIPLAEVPFGEFAFESNAEAVKRLAGN